MVNNKFLASFILLNNIYLTKCEDKEIEFSTYKANLEVGEENINFKGGKYILTINNFDSLNDLENKLKENILENFVLEEFTAYTSDDKILDKTVKDQKIFFSFEKKKKGKGDKRVVSPNIKFKVKFKVLPLFNIKCNIGNIDILNGLERLDSFKTSFESLTGRTMSEVALMNKLYEKKEKYLKKGKSDYYCDFNIKKDGNNIEVSLKKYEIENYKIQFNKDNFYDKKYFIGKNLIKLKAELVKLNGQKMSEDELKEKIQGLKNTCLNKLGSDYSDIIQTSKEENNIKITLKDIDVENIKELLYKQNYEFLLDEYEDKEAPDYCEPFKGINSFFNTGTGYYINKDQDFFYKKFTVNEILEMIKNKLIKYSDRDKEGNVPYSFEIELLNESNKKIDSSDSILEGGKYSIKIKDLFITKDQNQSVKDLKKLIEELDKKSKQDTPFATSVNGNDYITDKNNKFIDLKNKLKDIEFCKLFLEKNNDYFNIYIGLLKDKIKQLNLSDEVKKIISDIESGINNFIKGIKTWQYTNFSEYLDENNKIKDEKIEVYINNLITDAKNNNEGKKAEITNYYTEGTIKNNINNINTALNNRLSELKYSIDLVIKDNKKFKNEEYNNKFKDVVNLFKVCYKDYTFNDLLFLIVGSGIFNELDEKIQSKTKFYVNCSEITNLKDTITKNSTVEIEFDSSLYKDKNDKKDKDEEHNRDTNPQDHNTGNNSNEGNGDEVKKGCCVNKFKCSGCQKIKNKVTMT